MTFIKNNASDAVFTSELNNQYLEKIEATSFKKMLIVLFIVLFTIVSYFAYTTYFHSKSTPSVVLNEDLALKESVSEIDNETVLDSNSNNDDIKTTVALYDNVESSTKTIEKNKLLKKVIEKNIFQISSSNPEGFYVMVGSFKNYENAIKLQKMNPTEFTCHIFEPNYTDLNRVGLFISKADERKAQNALKEIKNMQKQSWLLYNSKN